MTFVPLSSPRFTRWALTQAKRQGADLVLAVVNSRPISGFGELDPDVTWLESMPGKPEAQSVAGEWLQKNHPDAIVVQHDQDDYYPAGSAAPKIEALKNADVAGSQVRRVWFEQWDSTHRHTGAVEDHWTTWGGSYAWRVSAFVPTRGPSRMFDDVCWMDTMVRSGARFAAYETLDTYCRWAGHRHVWRKRDRELKRALELRSEKHDPKLLEEARRLGCLQPVTTTEKVSAACQ